MTDTQKARTPTATRSIERELEIAAPLDAVWRALTEAEELIRWFPLEAQVTPGPGGLVRLGWGDMYQWDHRIKIWEPGRRLQWSYGHSTPTDAPVATEQGAPAVEIVIDFYLEARDGGTYLRLVHSGFSSDASWNNEYDGVRRGWRYELSSLRHYLERHPGVARRVVWAKKAVVMSVEEVWETLMSGDGFLGEGGLAGLRPGVPYSLRTAGGEGFSGIVGTFSPPFEFSGTVENLADSLLRIAVHTDQPEPVAILWLATYALSQARVDELQAGFDALLEKLFVASR